MLLRHGLGALRAPAHHLARLRTLSPVDLYDAPERYDLFHASWVCDLAYYVELAHRFGGPILEGGAGTGRLALPLARAGLEVWAVDPSAPMLRLLRRRAAAEGLQIMTVLADLGEVQLPGQPRTILLPLRMLNHVAPSQMQATFTHLRGLVSPGARLAADLYLWNPVLTELHGHHTASSLVDPGTGHAWTHREHLAIDVSRRMIHTRSAWTRGEEQHEDTLTQQLMERGAFFGAIKRAGWGLESAYADRRGTPVHVDTWDFNITLVAGR